MPLSISELMRKHIKNIKKGRLVRALLDTNIIIHRESTGKINQDIGTLFKWLDKSKYEKCIHPITIEEINKYQNKDKLSTIEIKLESYTLLKTTAPIAEMVSLTSKEKDINKNDLNDTALLNEVFQGRVDILISEDKKIHKKAADLGINDRVYNINGFLERVVSEQPELIDYKVLSVSKEYFGNINLQDRFFESFRRDYHGFDKWFNKNADKIAYVTHNKDHILSFLYVKLEDESEVYSDIFPIFKPARRLKIGTFKVVSNGVRLGERFLKIIFDNALNYKVNEIYLTIFDKTEEQSRLISLLKEWGFQEHGVKKSIHNTEDELVFVRDFSPSFLEKQPKKSYPYISTLQKIFLCPIYPEYHTELFPDSILNNESPVYFKENQPHRNALSKIYISRSFNRSLSSGDIIVFYRTGGYHRSVVTTIGIVENIIDGIKSKEEFILKCRKRSIFSNEYLSKHWEYNTHNPPFIINFLYTYSLPKRLNLAKLIELGVISNIESAPRGFEEISIGQFKKIIRESESNESIIID